MTAERSGDVSQVVRAELSRLLKRQPAGAVLSGSSVLSELGVGSLDLLELADALETALQVNPFDQGTSMTDLRTVGDLCAAYEAAAGGRAPASADRDELLQSSRRRAEARRRPRTT
jgi:acyl carrier protein